jgi:hypothetical protein
MAILARNMRVIPPHGIPLQWFKVLSNDERTSSLHEFLQPRGDVQIMFLITLLKQIGRKHSLSPESNAVVKQRLADPSLYETILEKIAVSSLDKDFSEVVGAVGQWLRVLSEAEHTVSLYTFLQHMDGAQVVFFIRALQRLVKEDSKGHLANFSSDFRQPYEPRDQDPVLLLDSSSVRILTEVSEQRLDVEELVETENSEELEQLSPCVTVPQAPELDSATPRSQPRQKPKKKRSKRKLRTSVVNSRKPARESSGMSCFEARNVERRATLKVHDHSPIPTLEHAAFREVSERSIGKFCNISSSKQNHYPLQWMD